MGRDEPGSAVGIRPTLARSGDRRYVRGVSAPWMSVVVPAYNEEAGISGVIEALRSHLDGFERPYEIIVVDNGSQDRTAEVVEALADGERLRVLRNEVNRGKGFSVRRGMIDARGDLRLLCDADCGPSLASLPQMIIAMENADVVAGSRAAAGAEVNRQQPLRRRLVGWPFIALTRMLMREPTKDVYCGFKLWRANAAEAVFPRQRLTGWVFDAEVLALARGLGFRVAEVGVAWTDLRGSKLSIMQVLIPAVRELLAARRNVRAQLHSAQRPVSTSEPADGPSDPARAGEPAPATTRDTR
jgi:dolichyl-phosphate beta-glucosyltransferase